MEFLKVVLFVIAQLALIIASYEYFSWRERRMKNPDAKSLGQMVRSVLPQEKAEFMLPMNQEEYDEYMEELSGRGSLLRKINDKMPWNSKSQKSQSLDS